MVASFGAYRRCSGWKYGRGSDGGLGSAGLGLDGDSRSGSRRLRGSLPAGKLHDPENGRSKRLAPRGQDDGRAGGLGHGRGRILGAAPAQEQEPHGKLAEAVRPAC